MSDRETRCYSGEVRAEQQGEQPTRIIGYGSVFNSRSEPLWGFREIIKPGAFDDVLGDDIRGLFNHDPNFILGRSASGTLSVSVDDKGLRGISCTKAGNNRFNIPCVETHDHRFARGQMHAGTRCIALAEIKLVGIGQIAKDMKASLLASAFQKKFCAVVVDFLQVPKIAFDIAHRNRQEQTVCF